MIDRAGSQRRGPMVEAPLQCQVRDIVASDTLTLRQSVLRPDLVRVNYRGDELPSTAHFGAYVDGRLVGVVSAFHESLVFPEAHRRTPKQQQQQHQHNCAPPPGADPNTADPCTGAAGGQGEQEEAARDASVAQRVSKLTLSEASRVAAAKEEQAETEKGQCAPPHQAPKSEPSAPTSAEAPKKVGNWERPTCPPQPTVERAIQLASEANSWRIRGLAVDLPLRGRGLGSRLISTCIQHAVDKRASCVWCVARCSAEPVYEKMGFQRAGQVFKLEGIGPVCYMIRALI